MTPDEIMFFNGKPAMLEVYKALRDKLYLAYPDITVRVSKTQISFRNRYIFAMVSLPARRIKGVNGEYALVSFGLAYKSDSPRIYQSVEPYQGRFTHHVAVEKVSDIDFELMGLIDEAYWFSLAK